MSIWKSIKSIFTGNTDDVMTVAKGVGNWIDEQQFTDEEKSVAKMKFFDLKLKWLQATTGQNLARRYCAIMFGLNFLVTFQVCLWVLVYGYFTGVKTGDLVNNIVELVGVFQLGFIMLAIIAFYFGKEMLGNKK